MSEFNWLWNVTKLRHLGDTIQCESKHLGAKLKLRLRNAVQQIKGRSTKEKRTALNDKPELSAEKVSD